ESVTAVSSVGLSDTPFLADLNGDGIPDSIVLDRSGQILVRRGLEGATSSFAPPVIFNPGRPAREITILRIAPPLPIAAAHRASAARFRLSLSPRTFAFTVSIYTVSPDGNVSFHYWYGPPPNNISVAPITGFGHVSRLYATWTTALPTSLAAADLTGDGLDDLV